MKNNIAYLKNIGHQLLEEYISLNPYPTENITKQRTNTYRRLEKQLKNKQEAHFSLMTSEEEILHANRILRDMIKKRIAKWEIKNKSKFAPNLMQLQKRANELNKEIFLA